eukprot:1178974-Prorocentrum_minimum.AAC.1
MLPPHLCSEHREGHPRALVRADAAGVPRALRKLAPRRGTPRIHRRQLLFLLAGAEPEGAPA